MQYKARSSSPLCVPSNNNKYPHPLDVTLFIMRSLLKMIILWILCPQWSNLLLCTDFLIHNGRIWLTLFSRKILGTWICTQYVSLYLSEWIYRSCCGCILTISWPHKQKSCGSSWRRNTSIGEVSRQCIASWKRPRPLIPSTPTNNIPLSSLWMHNGDTIGSYYQTQHLLCDRRQWNQQKKRPDSVWCATSKNISTMFTKYTLIYMLKHRTV